MAITKPLNFDLANPNSYGAFELDHPTKTFALKKLNIYDPLLAGLGWDGYISVYCKTAVADAFVGRDFPIDGDTSGIYSLAFGSEWEGLRSCEVGLWQRVLNSLLTVALRLPFEMDGIEVCVQK